MSTAPPRFSIVVPHYDGSISDGAMLRGLNSLAAQTLRDFEVLLLHDGPLTRPLPDLAKLNLPGLRFSAGAQRQNDWGHSLRDAGIRAATGDYVVHFNPDNVLSVNVTLPQSKYGDQQKINSFYNQLVERLSGLPGVEAAAIAYDHPLQANWIDSFQIEGRAAPAPGESLSANFAPVSPDYFRTVTTPILKGRQFTSQDDENHPGVVIVNETFLSRYFPDEPAIGQRLRLSPPAMIWQNQRLTSFEIIGIARDVKSGGLNAKAEPAYYVPAAQSPLTDMTILVRTKNNPEAIVPTLRNAVLAIDPNQPITNINTMNKIVADSIAQPRLSMTLMGLFGVLALILAAVGIYGLLSYAVAQRTQELGIRIALGAQVGDVLRLVLKQGMILVLIGEAIGLAGAFALTRLIRGLLFGVTTTDFTTFAGVAAMLAAVALVATFVPARRAAKVDPLVALRYE